MRQVCAIVLLLVVSASAFSTSSVSPADARRGLEAMNKALKTALSRRAFSTFAAQKFQVQQAAEVSPQCQAAAAAVGGAFQQCGAPPTLFTQEALAAYCTTNCTGRLTTAIDSALAACSNSADRAIFGDEGFEQVLRQAQGAVNTLCLKEGDNFCVPAIAVLDDDSFDIKTVTKETLDTTCSPCVHKLVMAAAASGGEIALQSAALEVMCNKNNAGQYCLLSIKDAFLAIDMMDDANPDFGKFVGMICNPCFRATITKMALFAELFPADPEDPTGGGVDTSFIGQMFGLICSRDDSGNFCMNRMANVYKYEGTFPEDLPCELEGVTPDTMCSAECKQFVQTEVTIMGCCTRALFAPVGNDQTITWAEKKCGVRVPSACQTMRVKGKLVLRNLRHDYVQANRDKVDTAIKRDLASFFDVAPSDIEIKSITQNTPAPAGGFAVQQTAGLAVSYEVTPSDSTHANTIKAKALTATNAPLASVAGLPLVAREDPAQPLSFDDADPKDIVVEGSAAGLKAGVAVAAAVVAAAVANLF